MATTSDYLGPRSKIAMARVMLGIDAAIAQRFAEDAFREVVELAFSTEALGARMAAPAPWPIRSEPALVVAYCEALELARRQAEADAQGDETAATRRVRREQREAENADTKRRLEVATSPAAAFLIRLQKGERIELLGHSLEWDDELRCLAGTNAYGVDYFWGDMHLVGVYSWRSRLLAGETIGDCPPCCGETDDDPEGYADHRRHEETTAMIFEAVDDLRWGQVWKFDETLQLITRLGFKTGLRCA